MSSLMFLIYISAMGVAIALGRQAKRHRAEMALQCARLGLMHVPGRPRIRMPEALLGLTAGLMFLVASAAGLTILLSVPSPEIHAGPEMTNLTILLFAAGLALVVLGGGAVGRNLTRRRKCAGGMHAIRGPYQ